MTTRSPDMGVIERSPGAATVRFTRVLPYPRSVVWRALTEPDQLAMWLDESRLELRVGGAFEIRFGDGTMKGVVTELDPERTLAYSWHEDREGRSHVRWDLSDEGPGTRLELAHTRLATEAAAGFAAGWHTHLERLESMLGGNDSSWQGERFDEVLSAYSASRT